MIAKQLNKVFGIVFFIIFAAVLLMVFRSVYLKNVFGVILAVVFLFLSVWIFTKLSRKFSDIDNKKLNVIFVIMISVMFIIQLVIGLSLMSEPVTDWNVINEISRSYAVNGNMDNIYENLPYNKNYLARYTNNNGIVILFSFYYRLIYLIFGTIPLEAPVILNTVFITASVLFVFFIAKKAFGNFHALVVAIICFMFLPFYTYCPYFYTDSVSMPFCILSIYLFICGYSSKKTVSKIFLFLFCGVTCAIGFVLKGSVIIVLVAVIAYMIYKGEIKKIFLGSGTVIAGFLALTVAFNGFVASLNIASKETVYEEQYPITHWIMMGLKGNGGFDIDDSLFTRKAGNYDEKKAANIEVIKQRLSNYGVLGLLKHFAIKADFTWNDGTYYIDHHIYKNPYSRNFLHELILKDGTYNNVFYDVSSGMQLLMLIMMCVSFFSCIRRPRLDYITLMHIIVFGVFIFFLVWEARSRYIFNFTPILIVIWADGIIRIADRLKKPITLREKLMKH